MEGYKVVRLQNLVYEIVNFVKATVKKDIIMALDALKMKNNAFFCNISLFDIKIYKLGFYKV